eukprot:CAMPEP_0116101008 /NCGR_PEP_ID=MMETSP0327-20121206/12583_1 /TAXON_ID=44447 /ORGANISM="Pseudo-nitzschia delicatissima, Strain B596" /LENGTH=291 /DNA_ID=CAMNT_0003592945 /DNA_START=29 /DNA_END=901 /DNA_ORIENTATION=+
MSSTNKLFNAVSAPCRAIRSRPSTFTKCPPILHNNSRKTRSLSAITSSRNFSTIPLQPLSIYAGGSFPTNCGSSCNPSLHSNRIYNSTTLIGKCFETRRAFSSRRKGGKAKKGKQDSNVISNEELISRLIRNAGESSGDRVTVRLVIDEGPDTPSSVEVITLSDAIELSLDRDLDLIGANIDGDPPVIRATQLSKLEYKHEQAQKKQRQAASNKKERKSFRFKAGIESNDLERKLDRLKSFLSKGHECEFTVFTKMRTLRQNPNAGIELVDEIRALLSDHGDLKRPPQPNE